MTEDTAARRLAKIIGRLGDMNTDINDLRLIALDYDQAWRAELVKEQAWSRRLSDVHRVWAHRLEEHLSNLAYRLEQIGVNDAALLDCIDLLDALRHDLEEAGS